MNRMRVLLINPQTPNFIKNREYYLPSNILYLAGALRNADAEVNVLDLNVYKPEEHKKPIKFCEGIIVGRINDFQPIVVGIGCLFSGQFPLLLKYSKRIKEEFDNVSIVIGGIHPTLYPVDILSNCSSIDYIILGEGEASCIQLMESLRRKDLNKLRSIDGFAFRWDDKVIVNPKTCFIANLDQIPFPAYDLIDLKDYYHDTSNWHNPRNLPINASIPILSSRSCPRRCNFCSMFRVMGPKWRGRSPENVVDEIELLYKAYNHRHFSFMDDNLTLEKGHVLELCNLIIKRNLNIQFETPNGIAVYALDEEIIDALVSAGLVRVSLAIESGSDLIRNKVMGKGLSRRKIYEVVKITKKYKELYVRAFFIMGMPEDTRETLMQTYDMIKEIDVDKPIVTNIMPFPGTRIFDQAVQDKLFIDELDLGKIWKMDTFYFTDNKRYFLKPYDLELEELQEFRIKFDKLIEDLIEQKKVTRSGEKYGTS